MGVAPARALAPRRAKGSVSCWLSHDFSIIIVLSGEIPRGGAGPGEDACFQDGRPPPSCRILDAGTSYLLWTCEIRPRGPSGPLAPRRTITGPHTRRTVSWLGNR